MPITPNQIAYSYEYAQKVHIGEMPTAEAADFLASHHGFNRNTAIDLIRAFGHMMSGHGYKRGLGMPVVEYYLEHIAADYGAHALSNALAAFMGNIEYEEGAKGVNRVGPRAIHARFSRQL